MIAKKPEIKIFENWVEDNNLEITYIERDGFYQAYIPNKSSSCSVENAKGGFFKTRFFALCSMWERMSGCSWHDSEICAQFRHGLNRKKVNGKTYKAFLREGGITPPKFKNEYFIYCDQAGIDVIRGQIPRFPL